MERQEHVRRPASPELSADALGVAARLQELSVDEAERVLERAIELQTRGPGADPSETINAAMLSQIAAELDIDPQHLAQALLEEVMRVETEDPGLLDRVFVPDSIVSHGVAPGSPVQVGAVVDAWMVNHEGMRKRAETPTTTTWENDRGFGAFVRRNLKMSRGTRSLRTAAGVKTSVRDATNDQQVVIVEADTRNLRRLAVGLVAGAAVLAGAATAAGVAVDPGGMGLDNAIVGAGMFAVLSGGVLIGIKMWAERIRDGLRRAVEAIGSPHLVDQSTSVPSTVRRFVDQLRSLSVEVKGTPRDPKGPSEFD